MNRLGKERWRSVCASVNASGDVVSCVERLTTAYSETHRHYHNLRHIAECLHEFDDARDLASSPASVELAIWFHDAVYDTRAADNEEQSARWAREFLESAGVDESITAVVSSLVLATKLHDVGQIPDAPLLVDIDLSILGQPEKRFWEYESQIREEYSWVEESLFRSKRAQILEGFLARGRIYSTSRLNARYERQAQQNLKASIARLRS